MRSCSFFTSSTSASYVIFSFSISTGWKCSEYTWPIFSLVLHSNSCVLCVQIKHLRRNWRKKSYAHQWSSWGNSPSESGVCWPSLWRHPSGPCHFSPSQSFVRYWSWQRRTLPVTFQTPEKIDVISENGFTEVCVALKRLKSTEEKRTDAWYLKWTALAMRPSQYKETPQSSCLSKVSPVWSPVQLFNVPFVWAAPHSLTPAVNNQILSRRLTFLAAWDASVACCTSVSVVAISFLLSWRSAKTEGVWTSIWSISSDAVRIRCCNSSTSGYICADSTMHTCYTLKHRAKF